MPRQRTGAIADIVFAVPLPRAPLAWALTLPLSVLFSLKVFALALTFSLAFPIAAQAALSCGLEKWLTNLNIAANTYVNALGTQDQVSAERRFRAQMERYSRAQLVDQINIADLGNNKGPLESFIVARRHLYDLSRDNWVQMAARYGRDARFASQSQSMSTFLQNTECDPFAEDFLNDTVPKPSVLRRVQKTLSALVSDPDEAVQDDSPPSALLFDPDNFDDFRAARYAPKNKTATIPISPSQNAPVFLGLFTFIMSASIWVWMRIGLAQRRAVRYACNLPIVIFDGSAPILGELRDLSQLGAKLETGLQVQVKSKLLITINDTQKRARVTWTNQHFIGVTFEKSLSEMEMTDILEVFAARVLASFEVSGGFESLLDDVYGTAAIKLSDYLARSTPDETSDREPAANSEIDGIVINNVYAPPSEQDSQTDGPADEMEDGEEDDPQAIDAGDAQDGMEPNDAEPDTDAATNGPDIDAEFDAEAETETETETETEKNTAQSAEDDNDSGEGGNGHGEPANTDPNIAA